MIFEDHLPATLSYSSISDAEFESLCDQFPDCSVEYLRAGTVLITPPVDLQTGFRKALIIQRLMNWSEADGKGRVGGPDVGFRFANGARVSPDVSWYDASRSDRCYALGEIVFVPEFVIELPLPSDRVGVYEKMNDYMNSGVQLAWLIDPAKRRVEVYRPGRETEVLENPSEVRGEGPVDGFVLTLDGIF